MAEGKNISKKYEKYSIEGDKLVRKNLFCPMPGCGPGVFLARHKDRMTCGKCGYKYVENSTEEE
ncbi:MAG: 30S ribosomal protein S27ae [Methanobacteriota archaeon]|mgnify:FL=1|nr:MAG: 30S ribosomal protein S27ae [Euryarchaeota archaeon]|tara:strand:+ start:200 stop:391 length:192 start_codon:yes stop_codon:yes gene_type:complete